MRPRLDGRHDGQTPRQLYRALILRGIGGWEAADLVGVIFGLDPHRWTILQINDLLAMRWAEREIERRWSEGGGGVGDVDVSRV